MSAVALATPALALLSGCASASSPNTGLLSSTTMAPPAWVRIRNDASDARAVYVSSFYQGTILGFSPANDRNRPPRCSLSSSYPNDIASDPQGNLIVPEGGPLTVVVYAGSPTCGPEIGSFSDPYGYPTDAASRNAATGIIYIGNFEARNQLYGDVAVCSLSGGCTTRLANVAIGGALIGVAVDRRGGVYASGQTAQSGEGASLVYWPNGKGTGREMTAFKNASPGGLDIDATGNILALDPVAPALWVYSGCPSTCAAHGPFPLKGTAEFGKVNEQNSIFEAADYPLGQVDVYAYHGTAGIAYKYSYNSGMNVAGEFKGIARSPAAH
ncbi:MAG: hypothetical protein JOZ77_08575 [Candidatus Eremiobacteraeota bacterium]|nr:hypothetical protein [Candidatus Eremiobacteraeota bacterium]